jgi:hypothetical protein
LCLLPLLSLALLTILQLDFLHRSDELVCPVVIDGLLLEEFIIEHLSSTQEESHPSSVQDAAKQEDGKKY